VQIALAIAIVFTSYIRLLSQFVTGTQLTVPLADPETPTRVKPLVAFRSLSGAWLAAS